MSLFTDEYALEVFNDLEKRYSRINVSTLRDILKGKKKAEQQTMQYSIDYHMAPALEEIKAAFWDFNCVILTAFRSGKTLADNLAENEKLKNDMKMEGLKYRPVKGCYRQADWEVPVEEHSFFVCNIDNSQPSLFFTIAYRLARKYKQDCFLFARGGLNEHAFLIATNADGRKQFKGDIKDAGRFYEHVPDVGDWTACHNNERFAFQSKEITLYSSGVDGLQYGEGYIFDMKGYDPDIIIVLRRFDEEDLCDLCLGYSGEAPLSLHVFRKSDQTKEYIRTVLVSSLNKALKQRCKKISILCTASIDGSYLVGARVVNDTVVDWIAKHRKEIRWVVLHDTYGNYAKINVRT